MTTDVARFVGDVPTYYDRCLVPVIFDSYAKDLAARVAAHGPKDVLETAAGTGVVSRLLRDALGPGSQLTATDFNAPMLEIARTKFRPGEAVAFETADAAALPFPDAAFDTVVCQFGLMFVPDKDAAHREARRVLRAGGRYLFNVWDSLAYNPFSRIAFDTLDRLFPDDPPQFIKTPFSCFEIDPIRKALIGAGFDGIDVSVVPVRKEVDDLTEFARGLVFGTPLGEQLRARGNEAAEQTVKALAEAFVEEFGPAPTRMPLQAIVFEAERG